MSYNNRKHNNDLIIKEIQELSDKYPDLRFHQILQTLGIIQLENISMGNLSEFMSPDLFHEESSKTYEKVIVAKSSLK